ncbi:hypothetical protein ACF8O9_16890 [Stenotrophomonas geniculata]|uniref:hypothetical protein n=1 Tax=Stenotrophomonas geniculata TaxID=86188 RepID=UPI00370B82DF
MKENDHQVSAIPLNDRLGIGVMLYAYATLLGASYIFSYWRPFGFDIFPYASAIDYVSAPLNRVLVLISVPALVSLLLFRSCEINNSRLIRQASILLNAFYAIGFTHEYYLAIRLFIQFDFYYRNEESVLVIAAILFVASLAFAFRSIINRNDLLFGVTALVMMQLALTVSAGYRDGKTVFNGADNVFMLDNKEICDPLDPRGWVYLGRYSDKSFFMNTIDKRICITKSDSIKLSSRKFSENL